jgi:hypothetical protein
MKSTRIFVQVITTKTKIMTTTIYEMVSTGNYDEKAITKFHAKQVKVNNGNIDLADAMVRMYKHNFLIKIKKKY